MVDVDRYLSKLKGGVYKPWYKNIDGIHMQSRAERHEYNGFST